MKKMLMAALFVASAVVPSSASTVLISNDGGGSFLEYNQRANSYAKNNTKVIISGKCVSACTLYTIKSYGVNACMKANTRFGFHKPFIPGKRKLQAQKLNQVNRAADYLYSLYHPKIKRFLTVHGWPSYHDGDRASKMTWMSAKEMEGVIPYCK